MKYANILCSLVLIFVSIIGYSGLVFTNVVTNAPEILKSTKDLESRHMIYLTFRSYFAMTDKLNMPVKFTSKQFDMIYSNILVEDYIDQVTEYCMSSSNHQSAILRQHYRLVLNYLPFTTMPAYNKAKIEAAKIVFNNCK